MIAPKELEERNMKLDELEKKETIIDGEYL